MKYPENIVSVAALKPDFLGFIFYDKSPRYFSNTLPSIPKNIKKVGVFVNASLESIEKSINVFSLDCIQLHGDETPAFCKQFRKLHPDLELWKVFSIDNSFTFKDTIPFENCVTHFLLDTKGEKKGGNGVKFNWDLLKSYTSKTPFILSGGIGLNDLKSIKSLLKKRLPLYAIDLNSKFELKPGEKDVEMLKAFIKGLKNNNEA